MPVTPFLKLQKPPFDTIPWDDAINGDMDIIDSFLAQFMSIPNFTGVWANSTNYLAGQNVLDTSVSLIYTCLITHTSAVSPTTFSADRLANPTYWVQSVAGTFPTSTLASVASVTAAYNDVGRNKIHNPMFNVVQRGLGPFTTNGAYTADRWAIVLSGDTVSFSIAALSDGSRTQIGDNEAAVYLGNTFTGSAAAGSFSFITQRIENVRRLGGKTVTVSFWANNSGGSPKVGINMQQVFGTGGAPSASLRVLTNGIPITTTATWTRYTTTITIPTVIGKTIGTNGDSYTALELWFSSGATNNAFSGSIGVQSGTVNLWGVQVEIGPTLTPLEKPDPRMDVSNCERFYQSGCVAHAIITAAGAANYLASNHAFRTSMRAVPTVTGLTNIVAPTNLLASITADQITLNGFRALAQSNAAGLTSFDVFFAAAADL